MSLKYLYPITYFLLCENWINDIIKSLWWHVLHSWVVKTLFIHRRGKYFIITTSRSHNIGPESLTISWNKNRISVLLLYIFTACHVPFYIIKIQCNFCKGNWLFTEWSPFVKKAMQVSYSVKEENSQKWNVIRISL